MATHTLPDRAPQAPTHPTYVTPKEAARLRDHHPSKLVKRMASTLVKLFEELDRKGGAA